MIVSPGRHFSVLDHVQGGAGLDGAADVQKLGFYENFSAAGFVHSVQAYQRSGTDGVENGVTDHILQVPFRNYLS